MSPLAGQNNMIFDFLKENSVFLGILKANSMFLLPRTILPSPGKKSADAHKD
jgi:hypothetical protein